MQKRTRTRTPPVTLERFTAEFHRGGPALDRLRAAQLAEDLRLESAMANVDAREIVRLRGKYGDDHARTKEIASRIEAQKEYLASLASAHRFASTPAVQPGEGWAVDGFVRTADGAPVANVTVAACGRQGQWHREFGYACTNVSGYFQIVTKQLPEKEMRVYMRAFERDAAMPSNENRLAPRAGRVDRVEIVVDRAGKGDCRPPGGSGPERRPPAPPAARAPKRGQPAKATAATSARTAQAAQPAAAIRNLRAKSAPPKKKKAAKRKARTTARRK